MEWLAFFKTAITGSWHSVWQMGIIILPLMVVLEVAKDMHLLDRIAGWMEPVMKLLKLPKEGAFPLLIGLTFGLAYGAGVIIDSVKEGYLTWRDLFLINVFLVLCHSVFEDTALFMTVGANGVVILASRIVLAMVVTFILSRWNGLAKLEKTFGNNLIIPHCSHCGKPEHLCK